MARKSRSIAGFDQVAGNNDITDNNNINTNTNENNNININNNTNNSDSLDSLLNGEEKPKRVLKGIYFDKDIADALDRLSEGEARGFKSELVNRALREKFTEKGYI